MQKSILTYTLLRYMNRIKKVVYLNLPSPVNLKVSLTLLPWIRFNLEMIGRRKLNVVVFL